MFSCSSCLTYNAGSWLVYFRLKSPVKCAFCPCLGDYEYILSWFLTRNETKAVFIPTMVQIILDPATDPFWHMEHDRVKYCQDGWMCSDLVKLQDGKSAFRHLKSILPVTRLPLTSYLFELLSK